MKICLNKTMSSGNKFSPTNFLCALIILLGIIQNCVCIKEYASCSDVATDLGNNATDGEYILYLNRNLAVSIYCEGFNEGNPREYLTLSAGHSNNFASVYPNVGTQNTSSCRDTNPVQLYSQRGRAEFDRIRIDLTTLHVQTDDYKFARITNSPVRYGHAIDKFSASADCSPRGTFKIDFKGTPFTLADDILWSWTGTYVRGSATQGVPQISNHSYVGCFNDAGDRLLASHFEDRRNLTTEYCIQKCKTLGYWFAGTQFFSQCFCGDNHDRHSLAKESECNAPCRGNNKEMCGGTWRISVYSTGVAQIFEGRCGGFPGGCFPASSSNPSVELLAIQVAKTHPCVQPVPLCKNEGKCIATTVSDFRCLCYQGYKGPLCDIPDQVISSGQSCPSGTVAEKCNCDRRCSGALFDGDRCKAFGGAQPLTTCRTGEGDHIVMFNVQGTGQVKCPPGSNLTGCTYKDKGYYVPPATKFMTDTGDATLIRYSTGTCSLLHSCQTCVLQARCKKYECGCQNGGHCHMITGECVCTQGYYGDKCENFDYCGYYEKHHNVTACGAGGICSAVPQDEIKAYGGDGAGDTCIFPFLYGGNSYGSCIQKNDVGPPFACGTKFDGLRDGYIDLGLWGPGTQYTIAAWVRPDITDTTRRTIVGGVGDCKDFGLYHFENFWAYYPVSGSSAPCTKGVSSNTVIQTGEWYLVASIKNSTHVTLYVNGEVKSVQASPKALPTTVGLWIGGEECCTQGRFKGMIKTVKIWKRPLSMSELQESMSSVGNAKSTVEAQQGGLVGHWELGEVIPTPCVGTDHYGEDWTLRDGQTISGVHCNISEFVIPANIDVNVLPWNGHTGGTVSINAKNIIISGNLNGHGAGYRGGVRPPAGGSGMQGESYPGIGYMKTQDNRGGGGGGQGGTARSDNKGMPGGGGGYGMSGGRGGALSSQSDKSGYGSPGQPYGDSAISTLYMGSGGGSGGSGVDLTVTPAGGEGGNGGAAISLKAEFKVTITSAGKVVASGENGQGDSSRAWCPKPCSGTRRRLRTSRCSSTNNTACWDNSGAGGGGSGGSIFISAKSVDIARYGKLDVKGGTGGFAPFSATGGPGGAGRLRIEYVTYTGTEQYRRKNSQIYSTATLQNEYMDHSKAGQLSINLNTTQYGNEVYRGCFTDGISYRLLSVPVHQTLPNQHSMTHELCMTTCRSKGYKFSGTEYSHECFCDNHLKMSAKRPDRECSTPCVGDSTEMCGGTNRILVFGPPPSTPAIGHDGAVSKCEPWCITADEKTDNPKWGQCSLQTEFVSSWKVHCECPAGFMGLGCMESCPEGQWGAACVRNCSCNVNNTASCLAQTGLCQCKPGYYGDTCDTPCPDGRYGANCAAQCNCTGSADCDKETGYCMCKPGWYGNSCKFPCPHGFFGRNCSNSCRCVHGSCEPGHGTCECDPGYELPFCIDACEPGLYGPDCKFTCSCRGQPCDHVTGVCQCNPGSTGHSCEQPCPFNTYGKNCAQNCDCFAEFDCDHVTGSCICGPGFLGPMCDRPCPQGTYGKYCGSHCVCQMNQTEKCDTVTGLCSCKPGFLGDDCTISCPIGFFGSGCQESCNCHNEAPCDRVTGVCTCPPGWTGAGCETACTEGFYGNCSQQCPICTNGVCDRGTGGCLDCGGGNCQCSEGYFGPGCASICSCFHGHCSSNGSCICSPGWQGAHCDQPCPTNHFGQGCSQTCQCVHGQCHQEVGNCICDPGFHGDHCELTCSKSTYGSNCRRSCLSCGRGSVLGLCDSKTGHCFCQPGYRGILCDQPCPSGKFGANCTGTCMCQNGGTCQANDGFCFCPDGWTGVSCQTKCPANTWGFNCSNTCDCTSNSNGCDPVIGKCFCKPGFTGDHCRDSCNIGYYGQNCTSKCRCAQFGYSMCSPIDGSCQCLSGYTGTLCDQACNAGKWGLNCMQNCDCSNRGNCNPFNGQCDCQPGYNGSHCEYECPTDKSYGKNCAQTCNCNGGHCDLMYGTCTCPAGKKGHHCEQDCESTHFGFECAQPCVCQNGGICNPTNGDCRCQPGWSGIRCDQKCPDGQYGAFCAETCPPCENDGSCDSITGQCVCPAGFMGPMCNSTCPEGAWGSGCSSRCPSSCPLTCFVTTGLCTCIQGTCLNGGTCTEKGVCSCIQGYHGSDCSQTTGSPWSGSLSGLPSTGSQTASGAIYLTKGAMAGLVLGLILLALIAVSAMFLLMRKKYTGQFMNGGVGGVAKTNFSPEVKDDTGDGGASGFSNPLHFTDFTTPKSDPDTTHKDSAA